MSSSLMGHLCFVWRRAVRCDPGIAVLEEAEAPSAHFVPPLDMVLSLSLTELPSLERFATEHPTGTLHSIF